MRLKHKLIATAKAIPTIVTLRHYYRCDDCGKLHRFTGHEFPAYGGLWEKYVFVSEECAENTIRKAHECLVNNALIQLLKGAMDDER